MIQKAKNQEDQGQKKFPFAVLGSGEYEYKGNQGKLLEDLTITADELFCSGCELPMLNAVDLVRLSAN